MARMLSVDFNGVEAGGTSAVVPEGDYGFKITKVVSKKSNAGNPCLNFSLKVISGNAKGMNKVLLHNCTLTKNSLWNLRNLLEAAGKAVPAKAIKIDLDKLVGLTLAGTVIDDEYKGRKKSTISAFFPMSDLASEAEGDSDSEDTESSDDEETESTESDESEESGDEEEEIFE